MNSLRTKIILGVLTLVMVLQSTSSWISYQKTVQMIQEALEGESRSMIHPILLDLDQKIANQSGAEGQVPEGIFEIFAGMLGPNFEMLAKARDQLKLIQFLDSKGKIVAHPDQDMVGTLVRDELSILATEQVLISKRTEGKVEILIPYFAQLKGVEISPFQGTIIFHYSDQKTESATKNALLQAAMFMLIYMVIGALGALFLSHQIVAPINRLSHTLQDIVEGQGDLTQRLEAKQFREIANLVVWFNRFIGDIQSIIRAIDQESTGLNTLSMEMSKSLTEINLTTDELAKVVDEEADEVARNSTTIQEMAKVLQEITREMKTSRSRIAQTMEKANDATRVMTSVNESIARIDQSSVEIKGIVKVITEISNQTNLLSLNAAIEAAKAGESGKGFSVVAEEVRNLAERSHNSVNQIKRLIETSTQNVSEGNRVINEANTILQTIMEQVQELDLGMEQVTKRIIHQDNDVSEIASMAARISENSKSNSVMVAELSYTTEQISTTTDDLSQMSFRLKDQVGKFKI